MLHYQQSLNDTSTFDTRSSAVQQQRDLRRSGRECVLRSSVHARSLFKDHQVTPIGPMLRATDSIFIMDIVLKIFDFDSEISCRSDFSIENC